MKNKSFVWIALATCLVLLVPLIAMQFTDEVRWDHTDFIVMGGLIFGISSVFVIVFRGLPRKPKLVIGIIFALFFLWLWAELAVGVFTNWGS